MAMLSEAATKLAANRQTPYLLIAAAVATAMLCSLAEGAVLAAAPATPGATGQVAPPDASPAPGGSNDIAPQTKQSLSEQQNSETGVITPPPTGDHDIQTTVPNPNAGSPKEVIPAPGSPGGNPNVEPR